MQLPSVIRIVAFEFAGGDAFFVGLILFTAAAIVATWRDGPRVPAGFRLATVGAAIVIAASGTPLPLWFYGIGVVLIVLSLWPRPFPDVSVVLRRRFRVIVGSLALWCAVGGVWELSYRLPPRINGKGPYDSLVVIGDSVSAGLLGPRERTWPKQFRERYFDKVVDLSAEGATARSALRQAESLNARAENVSAVVLIEIGGNDFFESVRPANFAADLDRLLTTLRRPNRQLLMLELPPFYNAYGRVQRELAAQHRVPLITKREFAGVVFAPNATLDTAHLSEAGHARFADMVWRHVGSLLRTP
jgi:acyl-CoA thioesterase I